MRDMSAEICAAGEAAVAEYKEVSGLDVEDQYREVYLSCAMARHLHRSLKLNAKVERYYYQLAEKDLRLTLPASESKRLEGLRADIVLYQSDVPVAIIEVKKFAEGSQATMIRDDLEKAGVLKDHVPVYVAVLVCETSSQRLLGRIQELKNTVSPRLHVGDPHESSSGGWKWCFGCVSAA
ncbi:MAG: hypothetical protein M0000_01595 [Actinomycetota bacterium]|nr:hypothetical protein [Actinomycetota bacterium]